MQEGNFSLFFSGDLVIFSVSMDILKNKTIVPKFEEVITIALQHFPELKNTPIRFIERKRFHFTAASLVNLWSLFGPRPKRIYTIILSNKVPPAFDHGRFDRLPQKYQIGLLCHELAHVVDYQQRNIFKIIRILLLYIFPWGRRDFERSVDIIGIKHGMWPYIYGFYTYFISKYPHKTKKFMGSYLDDDQIKAMTYTVTGKKI